MCSCPLRSQSMVISKNSLIYIVVYINSIYCYGLKCKMKERIGSQIRLRNYGVIRLKNADWECLSVSLCQQVLNITKICLDNLDQYTCGSYNCEVLDACIAHDSLESLSPSCLDSILSSRGFPRVSGNWKTSGSIRTHRLLVRMYGKIMWLLPCKHTTL